ncbi:MAG: TonB-dependent receptor [Cyclobacteriaceae bacterium]|nr:TonB-dependent receptor [Cyclobacteriaceae bacterium]
MIKNLSNKLTHILQVLVVFGLFSVLPAQAQTRLVTGLVKADTGEGLPGVNVLEKGTNNGTVTDADGKYSINVNAGAVLTFSFIGMSNQEVAVGELSQVNIEMKTDVTQLSELVVVGYGTQKKSDLTGAVSSVAMSEIRNVPVTRADQMLQGRVSGVQITQTSAEPGGNISIRIRGTNSINTSNQPLFVIDGFPGAGDLNSINPSDIESIDVLKDASATAIYGSRGANGVIIITTKKGKMDQNSITFEAYTGIQTVRKKYDLMNAQQFGSYLNDVQSLTNQETGSTTALPYPTQADLDALGKGTDWQDEIFRTAPIRNYQLGFNGGSGGTRYNVSMNYFDQDGIIINSGFKRGSLRFNIDRKVSEKLNFSFTSQLTRSLENKSLVNTAGGSAGGVVMDAMRMNPGVPVYDATGNYTLRNGPAPYVETTQTGNPVQYANSASDNRNVFRALLNAAGEYSIIKGLKLRVSGGIDMNYGNINSYVPSGIFFGGGVTVGSAAQSSTNRTNWVNENTLTYDKEFGQHTINVVGGFSAQQSITESFRSAATSFFTDALGANNLGIGSGAVAPTSSKTGNQLASFFGRINYKLTNKYLVTFTMRADGSSKFGPNKKWGYFPSGAIAWRIIEENFMKNITKVSDLKLRVGYGIVGNQEIDPYQSMGRYTNSNYVSGVTRLVGQAVANIANADLHWESTASFNVGIDLGLFDNRVLLTADYYDKVTSDLLLQAAIPQTAGLNSILLNAGKVGNNGFELSVTTINIDSKKVKWTTNLNFTRNRNKVLDLNGETQRIVGASSSSLFPGSGASTTSILRVGEPIGSFYGYQFDGIWQTAEEIVASGITTPTYRAGDPKYVDQDKNGIINSDDRVIIGRAQPDFYYGMTNTVTVGRLNVMVLLQGVQGQDVLNLNRYELESGTTNTNKMTTMLDRWTGPGTSNTIPKANSVARRSTGITSEVLEDGSFLRVKTITIGYDLPIPKAIGNTLKSASIYVTGQNLFTFTQYKGFDPEVNSFGSDNLSLNTDYNAFPASKTFIVGVRLGF